MQAIATIGLDIAKSVFQVHGVDVEGNVRIRRQLKRRYVLASFQKLPPCLALQKQGYSRMTQQEVGPMPPFGPTIKTDDDLWKIIAWIRSVNPNSLKPATVYPPWPG